MKKLQVKLTEMRDAEVRYVSLVDRAASRIPFRVIKADKEHGMGINLGNIGRILKGEKAPEQKVAEPEKAVKAEVAAIITFNHEDADLQASVQEVLKANGFSVEKATKNDDGTITYAQTDAPMEGATLVKLSDEVLLAVKGFDAYKPQADFNDVLAARGFLPGISAATEALYSSVCSSLYSVEDQAELTTKVDEIAKKFAAHVVGLSRALPSGVFKMDTALVETVEKAAKKKPKVEDESKETPADEAKEGAKDGDEGKAMKTEDQPAAAAPDKAAEPSADMLSLISSVAALAESMKELASKVDGVATSVTAVSEAQKTTEDKVAEISQKADTATNAVKNTILAAPPAGDEPVVEQKVVTEKSDPRSGCFDTAFLRRK